MDPVKPIYSHRPGDYECPFCLVVAGVDTPKIRTRQNDVVWRSELATAFIATKWWPRNKGHVLVVPNAHFENIFDLPPRYAASIHQGARLLAYAMKDVYACDGISTRQHNEPAGQQEVWHYHLHVYPRFAGDDLYADRGADTDPEERAPYAAALREWLALNADRYVD